jgi:nucleoside-diphosphate-sugar epimerase
MTDQLVLSEGKKHGVRTAVVVPPTVYGTGEGPLKNSSMAIPWLVDAVKKRGKAFTVGEGRNVVSAIHVRDLSAAFLLLVEQALEGGGEADWGDKGWYYVESGSYVFAELVERVVEEMWKKGLVEREGVDEIGIEEAKGLHPWADLLWGMNMRIRGERISGLGWRAKEGDVFSSFRELLA